MNKRFLFQWKIDPQVSSSSFTVRAKTLKSAYEIIGAVLGGTPTDAKRFLKRYYRSIEEISK